MKKLTRNRFSLLVVLLLILSISVLTHCTGKDKKAVPEKKVAGYEAYAGSVTCGKCHADIYSKHLKTAHYLTSQPATEETIIGSFAEGKNKFIYTPLLYIQMNRKDSGLYQSIYYKNELKKELKFALVTGSGTKGQTYLYRDGNKLFQMPVSYFTAAGQWANSPGFPSDRIMFDKPISTRCMECHTTYAHLLSEPDIKHEEFDQNKILYGIDCEKCHGPGAEHVKFQTENPAEKAGRFIVKQSSLSRQQQLDMCRLCHDGSIKKSKPSFSFSAGELLADYFTTDSISAMAVNNDNVDVHGNQFGLLKASKCFTRSNMTCGSCHNPHENEKGNLALYSTRCQGCHNTPHKPVAGLDAAQQATIGTNCIDCHMPSKPSRTLTLYIDKQETPAVAWIRSHYVNIYPEEVTRYVEGLKKKNGK